ncbi:MAG: transposase [Patescibacteria group bacterium]|jgi:REP element-mobilizing transposase RayT
MARPLRVEYPGALCHITSRGNAGKDIYLSDTDRNNFLKILQDVLYRFHWICHAYCLMNNHYHLLIETADPNLSFGMRDLNGISTQHFNKRHRRTGHIFQGRFQASIIEKESYLLAVARYIVLNPVRAGIVRHPKEWKWSSYCMTAGLARPHHALTIDWILSCFSSRKSIAQKEYRFFINEGLRVSSPFKDRKDHFILGSPQFRTAIWERTNGSEVLKEIPRAERVVGRPTLKELFKNWKDIEERNRLICFARTRCGYLNTEIAAFLKLHGSTIGKIVRRNMTLRK